MGREAKHEKAARTYAEGKGIWTRKFTAPANRSVPDRIFGFKGIVLFIEFKAEGKVPTDAQADELREMQARDIIAVWSDNIEDTLTLLRALYDGDESILRTFMWSQAML